MAYVTVDVDIDMDEFSDDEIAYEYRARGLGDAPSESEETQSLTKIRQLMLLGKKDEAYESMYEYVRNKLGTAI